MKHFCENFFSFFHFSIHYLMNLKMNLDRMKFTETNYFHPKILNQQSFIYSRFPFENFHFLSNNLFRLFIVYVSNVHWCNLSWENCVNSKFGSTVVISINSSNNIFLQLKPFPLNCQLFVPRVIQQTQGWHLYHSRSSKFHGSCFRFCDSLKVGKVEIDERFLWI